MESTQFSYLYNIPDYTQPEQSEIKYDIPQVQNYQGSTTTEEYPTTYEPYNQSQDIAYNIESFNNYKASNQQDNYNSTNNIEQYNNNISNINEYPVTSNVNNFNMDLNSFNVDYQQQANNQFDNYNINYDTNLNIENTGEQIGNTYLSSTENNEQINTLDNFEQNLSSGIQNQGNQINTENNIQQQTVSTFPNSLENISNTQKSSLDEKALDPFNQVESVVTQNNDSNLVNNSIPQPQSSEINQLNNAQLSSQVPPQELNQSIPHISQEPKKVSTPKLVNPLETKLPPSPSIPSMRSMRSDNGSEKAKETVHENIIQKEEPIKEELNNNNMTKDEEILLKNEKEENKNKFDIKSHFDLTLTKEENDFYYKKVHKVSTFLLGHYEMPDNLEYVSPILSPNGKYLACLGKGDEDSVYVWDISDLYWYKYKFSYSKVECIIFTPDSKGIIIVYENSNPIMYDLSTGKMKLEFEKIGRESTKTNFNCAFAYDGSHFALTTSKSYTLWSLKTGKVKQYILDESPIKILSNNHLILIDRNLNCFVKKIADQSIIENFQIKGVESYEDILDARCTKDMANLIYVIKHGIIVYNYKKQEFNGLQKFECGVEKAVLSEDGKYIMKTNYKNLCVNDLEKNKTISTILKDKFKQCEVFFNLKKMVIIDNISIIIQDIFDETAPEKYVWLNKNPTKFEDVKFSSDFKILLARLNRNDAIAYDVKTGYVLKKWENLDENWLDYSITTFGGDKIAVKTSLFMIKVWNFRTGREEATFYGYNSHSLNFSSDGDYLACGTQNGSEIARIWDINRQKYGIYKYNGNNNNYHTVIHLTSPEPKRLICCAVDQQPLIFNSYTKELLFKCECPFRFEEIYEIQSELRYDVFIVKGRDNKKRNVGIMYRISDGSISETYVNYTVLDLARFEGILIVKCDNINGGKLFSTDIKNLEEPLISDFQIQSNKCVLLNDHKTAMIEYGDEFSKEFILIDIKDGNCIGKINFVKKNERNSEYYITADPLSNEIYFRYFEFLTPQETMVHLKKNIFNVEEEENA